ncbi:MAG: MMPL family transporter [bacterium]
MFKKIIVFSINRPKTIMLIITAAVIFAAAQLPRIRIDTDPENMLSEKEFVRVFHHQVKQEFSLYDYMVLGFVNDDHPNGVFNVETLNNIYAATEAIKCIEGVITREIISPSMKDNIRQGGMGAVVFEWLMKEPISTDTEALKIRDEALDNPIFKGTMVSEDGKALCIYVPLEQKNMSYRISQEIDAFLQDLPGNDKFYITGLPIAEDTFGVEMFKQMAISAPLAGLVIFLLMWFFFKNLNLIISPMILAVVTVVATMGALIGLKFPVHIMSSMIPIFLMPIAVLDSVHILSEFFDKYPVLRNKRSTIIEVMDELFTPMLYTSLTSAIGFFSLSFSPIPPVQTFGVFVAFGIMIAWILTITFIPAYIALINEKSLENFGFSESKTASKQTLLTMFLAKIGSFSVRHAKHILSICGILVLVSLYGISRVKVNDNPVKWFAKSHTIRVADRILNEHFGGTYTAYLIMEAEDKNKEVCKEPAMLIFVEKLQKYLYAQGDVGKSTSLADVVKKVYYELLEGDQAFNVIPQTKRAVSQCLISYENSHKPDDLWHFTTPDYTKLNIWIQLTSGDNKDMEKVLAQVDTFMNKNKPPFAFSYDWAGLTYINVVWQNKMVVGMLKNFMGSFIIVFFIMTFLFRSPLRGLISMVPLTITILFIYSLLGFIGKDYDMPVAILSALTLGLSIDFAIHFIQRARSLYAQHLNWDVTVKHMFQEPSRAIARNALVVAIGFLPLLAAPLIPYKTVGFFMFTIMLVSSIATLVILPAILTVCTKLIVPEERKSMVCNCGYCFVIAAAVSVAVVFVLMGYTTMGWKPVTFISIGIVAVLSGICSRISKNKICVSKEKES